ncbi:MAG: hypothetical protein NZ651_06385 [Candidatus Bipolaricaulota bacterium]|nr:hypothetical protein [Candidatus Bipolaricaulota bacterium]MDW8127382.1 hypothetical protein [Candidatus Bipolaricaulota bacterium]
MAPFYLQELVEKEVEWSRPYLWSADYRFLSYVGPHLAMVWLPSEGRIPRWFLSLAEEGELYRFPEAGDFALQGHRSGIYTASPADLVVVCRGEAVGPRPIQEALEWAMQGGRPILERFAQAGGVPPRRGAILWPEDNGLRLGAVVLSSETLFFRLPFMYWQYPRRLQWEMAEALATAFTPDRVQALYIQLYLMEELEPVQVTQALDWLARRSQGHSPPRLDFPPLSFELWSPSDCLRVLHYWEEGKQVDHVALIRRLRQGGGRDRN